MEAVYGRWRVLEGIGSGGMARVHRAEHLDDGRRVALKTVRDYEEHVLHALRREIRSLSEIEHPGVVSIVDHGIEDGCPWYAMGLIEGEELSAGLPLGVALGIFKSLCATLSHLHAEGIVHRDLKPENVMVDGEGRPIIIDFGLQTGTSRESVRRDMAAGTAAYMAPEQARGERVDARADLYSLGCLAYEILVGEPPFTGANPVELIRRHAEEAPEPLSRRVPELPAALDALILSLLAKERTDRIGYAADVHHELDRLGVESPTEWPVVPARHVYRPGFVGNVSVEDLVGRLRPRRGEVSCGHGILAGAGLGKTRLLAEISDRLEAAGVQVMIGRAEGEMGRGEPLMAFRDVLGSLADRCRERGPREVERTFGSQAPVLAPYHPGLASLPGVAGVVPAVLGPEGGRQRLLAGVRDVLARAAARRPMALLVDDAHLMDDLSRDALKLLHRSPVPGLVVVASQRSDLVEDSKGLWEDETILSPLSQEEVGVMVRDMLAVEQVPTDLAVSLHSRGEGNPQFVTEYLRSAVQHRLLARNELGQWCPGPQAGSRLGELPIPESVEESAALILEALPGYGPRPPRGRLGAGA